MEKPDPHVENDHSGDDTAFDPVLNTIANGHGRDKDKYECVR